MLKNENNAELYSFTAKLFNSEVMQNRLFSIYSKYLFLVVKADTVFSCYIYLTPVLLSN